MHQGFPRGWFCSSFKLLLIRAKEQPRKLQLRKRVESSSFKRATFLLQPVVGCMILERT
jgi:hypothetical protein